MRKGLSLQDLAREVGTSASAIHRYESGWDRFELRTLRRLASALGARLEIRLESVVLGRRPPASPAALLRRIRPLFWDVDLQTSHFRKNPQWVLRRVLQFGDWEQVHAVRAFFGDEAVRRAARHRSVDPRTRRLWQVVLGDEELS